MRSTHRRPRPRSRGRGQAAAAVLLAGAAAFTVALYLTACGDRAAGPSLATPAALPPSTSPPPPSTPPPTPAPHGPVLAVKVDNAPAARPAVGLSAADVVYVEPIEGGATRLIALFAGQPPPVVGPVRSARETDLELLPQFGRPTLAYSGAAPALMRRVRQAPIGNASASRLPGAYFRADEWEAPHNLFVRARQLPRGAEWPPSSQLMFGPAPVTGEPRDRYVVSYPAASVGFDWSPAERRWLVSFDGAPAISDTRRLTASTVVVQQVPIRSSTIRDVAGTRSPVADTIGRGRATVLRDGQAFPAVWSRPAADRATTYTTPAGRPLPFAAGPVWIVLTRR